MGWYILLGLLALVLVLLLLPVGIWATYDQGDCQVWGRYLWLKIPLYPRKKKPAPKGEKEKTPSPSKETQEKQKEKAPLSQTVETILLAIRSAMGPLEKLAGRIRFSVWLHLVIGGEDAMETALAYGRAHGVVSAIFGTLSNFLHIRLRRVWIQPDFLREEGDIRAKIQVRFAPWMILFAAVGFGVNFLKESLARREPVPPKNEPLEGRSPAKKGPISKNTKRTQ